MLFKMTRQKRRDDLLALESAKGHMNAVKALLEAGADVHARDDYALREASKNGRTEAVMALLEAGAYVIKVAADRVGGVWLPAGRRPPGERAIEKDPHDAHGADFTPCCSQTKKAIKLRRLFLILHLGSPIYKSLSRAIRPAQLRGRRAMTTQLQTAITIINAGIEQEFAELRRSHPDQELFQAKRFAQIGHVSGFNAPQFFGSLG